MRGGTLRETASGPARPTVPGNSYPQRALPACNEWDLRMMDEGNPNIDTTRARAGSTPHMTRYILPMSLGLVVILFLLLLLFWR